MSDRKGASEDLAKNLHQKRSLTASGGSLALSVRVRYRDSTGGCVSSCVYW